jgi:hypothetical protein
MPIVHQGRQDGAVIRANSIVAGKFLAASYASFFAARHT